MENINYVMNIVDDDYKSEVPMFPLWSKFVIPLTIISTLYVFMNYEIVYGLLSSISILAFLGFSTMDSWNKELRFDGYASIHKYYNGYVAAGFLFMSLSFTLLLIIGSIVSIVLALITVFIYTSIQKYIAFRKVNSHKKEVETYYGPPVFYIEDGLYIDHIEKLALENKNSEK